MKHESMSIYGPLPRRLKMGAPLAQWGGAPGENILRVMVHHGETWKKLRDEVTKRWEKPSINWYMKIID